jgi:S1-C subfamily serine protease
MKFILLMLGMLLSAVAMAQDYKPNKPTETVNTSMRSIEKKVRDAAVRVTVPLGGGHGSGSYILYKDVHLVITAQHVVDAALGETYLVSHKGESHLGTLIYSDKENDIGILYIGNPFKTIAPIEFNPLEHVAAVGTEIFYSGYPSHHKLMSFTGRVAGYETVPGPRTGKHIILQTYGWFGCSGSVIYNLKGQQVGILYGVDVEYYPDIQVQENVIWVVPISEIKIDKALGAFCRGYQGKTLKACK